MKQILLAAASFLAATSMTSAANTRHDYTALDKSAPIVMLDGRIVYASDTITLSEKNIFLDGNLTDGEAERMPFVYNTLQKAVAALTDGTPEEPMNVFVAPYVYWADDPDNPEVAVGKDGREPFGMVIRCDNLHIVGLTDDARKVVLASQRGQTQGAVGNFTMFDFHGDGLHVSNLTMGNFCNVDLDYPLLPELSRRKRNEAITQAHVAYTDGDRVVARNVRFISRLNMNPLNGAKRILFDRCHMECTDDALTGNGVYLKCTVGLYGQKPFYTTHRCGAVFLGCRFEAFGGSKSMVFCKAPGALALIGCRYTAGEDVQVGWTNYPTAWLRCYQADFRLNGTAYRVGAQREENTVCIDSLDLLAAFCVPASRMPVVHDGATGNAAADTVNGQPVIYNVYNLLRGNDGWDPLCQKRLLASLHHDKPMPTALLMNVRSAHMVTGREPLVLKARTAMHGGSDAVQTTKYWRVEPGFERYVSLSAAEGDSITLTATNNTDETATFFVEAYDDSGLRGAMELTVKPSELPAPLFLKQPRLKMDKDMAVVDYALNLDGRADRSLITWYRRLDDEGVAVPIAVSRDGIPERCYRLTAADRGHEIYATVEPCHNRSVPGTAQATDKKRVPKARIVPADCSFATDFRNFPTGNQPRVQPGLWTVDGYKPADTQAFDWNFDEKKDMWVYGKGYNGAVGCGLLQAQRGARLMYTPVCGNVGDMELVLEVDPTKTAGQGFGSATGQYMDVCLKFDTRTLTGYGLRIVRTIKHAKAVDFLLVRYDKGEVTPLSEPVSAICYRTGCTIALAVKGGILSAHVETATPLPEDSPLARSVDLSAAVVPGPFGGIAIQHTGTCGEGTTMLHVMKVVYGEWKPQR
ncbi:MAG: hypothetical protein ACI4TW_04880 [Prevotella sp.]